MFIEDRPITKQLHKIQITYISADIWYGNAVFVLNSIARKV